MLVTELVNVNALCKMKTVFFCVLIIQCFLFVSSLNSNPLKDPHICGLPACPITGTNKFKYGPGRYETYKYSVEARSIFNGTSKNESTLFIDAEVTLNFLTPCDALLTLSDITLSEIVPRDNVENPTSTNSQLFSDMISEHSLRFAFRDGVIYEICPQEEEKSWPLNFKRGILSMIQNSMKRFDLDFSGEEEDVRGICPTTYRVIGAKETSLVIEKIKDLENCDDRIKFNTMIQATPVDNFRSKTKSSDILKSSSRCVLSIDNHIYNEISCEENYVLEPFSNNAAGASTTVKQKLTLKEEGEHKITEQDEISRRTTLKFDHLIPKQPTNGDLKATRDLIKKLCKENQHETENGFSDLFGKFIYGLRSLAYPALSSLYSHSPTTCPSAKKHILDALPYVNTAGSLALIKDIIMAKTVPESTVNDWMLHIAVIPNPDENIMESALIILKEKEFSSNVALGIAALTHTFCKMHSNCIKSENVVSIVEYFENYLLTLARANNADREVQENIIVTLKALSSIGVISENFEQELFKFVEDPNLDVGIRVAAVETFRRLPCERSRSYFESIFEDPNHDTEVRISAYLQVMRCPSYLLVRTIAHNLKHEEVNQVGCFVWSHLHNIIKSANPLKIEIQSLLSDKDLVDKFSKDIRKFSHNREGSLYLEELNVGGNYESNVIFSPSSYIPRNAMLNLTVDLFGKSVNLLEVYGRVEGFERYLESFFGPGGKANGIKEKMEEYKMRLTRQTNKNNLIESKVNDIADIAKNIKDPKVALGLKVFGNDLKYSTFRGDREIKSALENFNFINHFTDLMQGKKINFKKASMFLDSNYMVSSGAGLPLTLSLLGTASVSLKMSASINTNIKNDVKNIDLNAHFEPSALVDISAEMSLNAFYESTGIKLKTSMQSSTAVKAEVKIHGHNVISVKFNLPRKTAKIFGARSELLVKQNNQELSQNGLISSTVSNSLCSWPAIAETIGLKLCFDYNFKNTSRIFTAPYFILAGPANFDIYIEKSDPTADTYLFVYKFSQTRELGVLSLIFDTPGSAAKRLIHANLTSSHNSHNITMLMQSSAGTILARGRIKNSDDEKILQMTLDINNQKHFDASIAYQRLKRTNGYTYKPKVYLGVNGERVMELEGSIDLISKKDISQYTVDLKFHTKRLTSKLFGYISKTESSVGTDLHLDYKFLNTKEHRVSLKFSLANRSKKNIAIIVGTCDVYSTAYPNFNFYSNVTFQRSGSHMELRVALVQNPLPENDPEADYESLKFNIVLSHKAFTDSKQAISAVATVIRKSSNLDMKAEITYESINYDYNFDFIVNYGDNKQVSVTVFFSNPRTTLEEIKAHVNVTVPSFTPMIVKVEISEKQSRDYKLNLSGTWFSGHSANAIGFYQDKSTAISSNHHVKLFIKSPSFKDINADFQLYRDSQELKVDFKALHEENDYQFFLNHNNTSEDEMHTNARLKYKAKLYTLNTAVHTGEHLKITTELHIDQLRDIEFSVWIFNEEMQKALGFDINWDANRDPNQKLLVAANFTKAANFNYNADLIVSYPGRTIIGKYQFMLQKGHIDMLASISYDDGKSFSVNLNVIYRYDNEIFFEISSRLNTPLDSWRNMKLLATFEHIMNKYSFNSALTWNSRQKIAMDLFGDYTIKNQHIDCKYSCSVESTLNHIPNATVTFQHMQNVTNYDTNVYLKYNPEFIIDVDSKWLVQKNENFSNLTGTIKTQTPFKGLNKGVFVSKISYTSDKYLRGVAEVTLDHKNMLVDMEGKFKKLMDSMFIANITTPDEKYQCRFKLSKKEKHFVALLTYPSGNLGTEVLLVLNNMTDFDLKFLLATPVEFLQSFLIRAKLNSGEVDLRIGWNSLLLGFSGVWHYVNIIDFEYSYKIYTPIKDFEENGVVGKLIVKEGLDFEISLKLSLYKLGVKLIGKPKRKPLKELGINVGDVYYLKPVHRNTDKDDDFLSWEGLIELDAIIYPTMKGQLEIDKKGSVYILQSKIHLPHGLATVFDEFEYIDIFSMSNDLLIVTPYQAFKKITSDFKLNIIQGEKYLFKLGFLYENNTRIVKTGVFGEYNAYRQSIDERSYNVTIEVNTPFEAFPNLNLFGAFESEENFYHTKLLFNTNRSDISIDASSEFDEGYIGITSDIYVKTSIINIPQCQLLLNKLTSYSDNYVQLRLRVPEVLKSEVYFRSSWLIRSSNQFRTILQLETPFKGFENTTTGVDVLSTDVRSTLWAFAHINPIEIDVNATLEDNVLRSTSLLQFNDEKFPVNINCKIFAPSSNQREFNGSLLLKDKVFKINGNSNLIGSLPVKLLITFTPEDKSVPLTFQYNLETTLRGYELVGFLSYSERLTRFSGEMAVTDKFNWEINLQIVPTEESKKLTAHFITKTTANSISVDIDGTTQIPKLETYKAGLNLSSQDIHKNATGYFVLSEAQGNMNVNLIWIYLENMLVRATGKYKNPDFASTSSLETYYKNPGKLFQNLETGGDLSIDRLWEAGANVSLKLPNKNNIGLEGHLKIPNDFREIHSLLAELNYKEGLRFIDYLVKYRSTYPVRKYGSWAKISLENKQNISGDAVIEWDGSEIYNSANLKRLNKSAELVYKLKTPKYADKQLFVADITYDEFGEHHNVTCKTFLPEDVSLAYGTIDYKELANMFGMFNVSVPYRNLNFSGAFFKTETNNTVYNRYIKAFWANKTALLDSRSNIKNGQDGKERNYKGNVVVELPLATKHIATIDYEYDKKAELSTGRATVEYNGENVLQGKYNCLSKSQAGQETDTIHVELLNKKIPLGADYVHRHENSTPEDGYGAPTVDNKHLHLYHLQNRSKFNLTGEINVKTDADGQAYILKATHLNRTVSIWTDYSMLPKEYRQHSRFELSPTIWVEYDFSHINKTTDDIFDAEIFLINMSYPRRSFQAQGSYNISDAVVTTDVSLMWDRDNKSVAAAVDWRRINVQNEQLQLLLKHPSFQKDVSFITTYGYGNSSVYGQLVIDYSTNPDKQVSLGIRAEDKSKVQTYNYSYNIWAEQPATNLYLNCVGIVHWSPSECGTKHIADYKRSYLSLSRSLTLVKVDFDLKDALFKKESVTGKSNFWGRYGGSFPIYTANMTTDHGINHTSGKFFVNFREKLLYLNVNLTEDGSQSLHTYGIIPDARRATFDIWRDYEDKRLTDVSYYLKLNHSRLIMSKLRWRPELISEVQNAFRSKAMQLYNEALEEINNTRQYIKAESVDAIEGIWQDAKPIVQEFLTDLRNLTVIEEDFEYLKTYLNTSYHNNEFYIKDIWTVIVTLFDDLSLKSHLQSLPKIFQELWTAMGASGKNIKESINFVIEKIKLYYANTTQFIHDLINGDPVRHISNILEKLVDKYDDIIKNIHVAVLQYMENLWAETYKLVIENWHQTLAALEPTFLKFIHYLESIVWSSGKEFLDFLYIRKNKIIESAYFMEFTKFSRDVDRFYKDITGNNTVEAIYKYSSIAWSFLNEKYINHIPFGKELKSIVLEIFAELQQLGEVPAIKYVIIKYNEALETVKYYYKYFEVEYRVHQFIKFVYRKLTEMTLTALELENRDRDAKTKFVYEPNDGVMLMEQKLPMSWHAFNETPNFQEIPEIKLFYDIYNYLATTEASFWNFYYDYKPYTDPSEWLPPFKGYAMLMGGKYYVTFDKKYYSFRGSCTYLLATDVISRNFTLLVSYDEKGFSNQLILLIRRQLVTIDFSEDTISIDGSTTRTLPIQIENSYLYREADMVIFENPHGFILQCNMKFQICTFEISGWHFARTAGLWGTYNNEPFDDLSTPNQTLLNTTFLSTFADTWSVDENCQTEPIADKILTAQDPEIITLCNEFFLSKVSDLSTCFPRVPKETYLSMCKNSSTVMEACRSAISYIEICGRENTPLNVPDSCIRCNLLNGTELGEGDFVRLQKSAVPRMADIVFIVEAKDCNKDLKNHKNFKIVVESINRELLELNITNNRYAVVVFGGNGVFNAPRSIVLNSKTFTDANRVLYYLNNILLGNGSSDIYEAITFANKLMFRPGVSRNFILIPCSQCQEHNMQHDYSIVHQLLFENSVTLHILMNSSFNLQGPMQFKKENKDPFGVDLNKAYTKKDIKKLDGDQVLRNSISLPKSTLGLCFSLALETNGTVFSIKHLEIQKNAKKFATVFAKRVAQSAVPRDCMDCECATHHHGLPFMECYPCTYPRSNMEHHNYYEDEDVF